jgi:hypothetical protein
MGFLLCCTGWLIPALPARQQAAGDVSANTGGPHFRAEWSGQAKDTPQSIPAGLLKGLLGTRLNEEAVPSGQRERQALTDEPDETAARVLAVASKENPFESRQTRHGAGVHGYSREGA